MGQFLITFALLGLLIVAAGIFLWRSVDQLRDDVKASVAVTVTRSQADVTAAVETMKTDARKELGDVRTEVRQRVADEFETEQITALVRDVAKDRSEKEFQEIIRSETSRQVAKGLKDEAPTIQRTVQDETKRAVKDLQPTINGIVGTEVKGQVDKSVIPIQSELRGYENLIRVGSLATLAKSDDRKAFDQLMLLALGSVPASEDEKRIAYSTVVAVVREKNSGLRLDYGFKEPQTPASMKSILQTSKFANDKMAAIEHFPNDDYSILPILIQVISNDESLDVLTTAGRKFNEITGQKFEFPTYGPLLKWWDENKAKFQ